MKISVIAPVYNAENIISEHITNIFSAIEAFDFKCELIVVDCGGVDKTGEIIKTQFKEKEVIYIKSKEVINDNDAITLGFPLASGDAVITFPLSEYMGYQILQELIVSWKENNKITYLTKHRHFIFRILNNVQNFIFGIFYRIFNTPQDFLFSYNIQLFDKEVADVIKESPEKNLLMRNFDVFFGWKQDLIFTKRNKAEKKYRRKIDKSNNRSNQVLNIIAYFFLLWAILPNFMFIPLIIDKVWFDKYLLLAIIIGVSSGILYPFFKVQHLLKQRLGSQRVYKIKQADEVVFLNEIKEKEAVETKTNKTEKKPAKTSKTNDSKAKSSAKSKTDKIIKPKAVKSSAKTKKEK